MTALTNSKSTLYLQKAMIYQYLKEFLYLRVYILILTLSIILSYSVYFLFDTKTIAHFWEEDSFFEIMTPIYLFLASLLFFVLFLKSKNFYVLILSFVLFFGAGEEISWGQRILGFNTPETIKEINVQQEFNIHNIELFNSLDNQHHPKKGISRLLEINFLFRLFTLFWGIVLPVCLYQINSLRFVATKMKIPIPPVSIGIFFLLNWLVYWLLHTFILSPGNEPGYLESANEIFESVAAFILFVLSIYFFTTRKIIRLGNDIKIIL
jgi:hypothetical protein